MHKLLVGSIAVAALIAGPAMAADMPVRAYLPPPVPVFSWTGFYIGGHVGGAWGHKDWTNVSGVVPGVQDASYDVSGWLAGGQVGFDYQAGWVVWGVQADISGANITKEVLCFTHVVGTVQSCSTKIKSLATVTTRLGAAFDRGLVYILGGWAWAKEDFANPCDVCGLGDAPNIATASETRNGWTVGVGGEYVFAGGWSAFLQYNYIDFGTRTFAFVAEPSGAPFIDDINQHLHVVKVGLNFRFY